MATVLARDTPSARLWVARFYRDQSALLVWSFSCLSVGALGLMHGGYFATAWGWGSISFLWVAVVALIVSDRLAPGPLEWMLVAALCGFLVWSGVSGSWSNAPGAAIREVERGVLLLSALLTAMLLARRRMEAVLSGVFAAITIVSSYGLATRLFPSRLSHFDAVAGYRLAEPLGYWNALGLAATIGILLALGFAARSQTAIGRAAGFAAPVVLFPVLYFTFGRGPWAALVLGVAVAVALDRQRLQLITTALLITPFVGVALWVCSREPDLNRRAAALAGASSEGRRVAIVLTALVGGAALTGAALGIAEGKLVIGRTLRITYVTLLGAVVVGGIAVGFARYGPPQEIASRAYRSFKAEPVGVAPSGNLSQRLLSLSNNGRLMYWRVAVDDFRAHPWLGSGAGTFERTWLRDRSNSGKVRDAHNLYVEVLAELGIVGVALLALGIVMPIVGAAKARRHRFVPIALGAYVAYLAHAAVDWDWEMPAITIAGFLCGVAILVAARGETDGWPLSGRVRISAISATVAIATFAFVGLMGNLAIAASNNAASDLKWRDSVRHARDAKRWMPWSSDPWRLQGEAQYALGNFDAAGVNFRKAISKDPHDWLLWADLATVGTHGTWRAPARRALELNPLAPELVDFRKALGGKD